VISLTHILLIVLVLVILFGPNKLPALGRTFGQSARNFKKALKGEEDIDITHTVKRLDNENKDDEQQG
jgi:sec-independent protein translocase protein TatA